MNKHLLNREVQTYINSNLLTNVNKIALTKSPFINVSAAELAEQIAAKKKAQHKLPTWFATAGIYYPVMLSVEQCSSEPTAAYKANLVIGNSLIDLTAGFGVDSYFFAKKVKEVYSCEINDTLSAISAHNAITLGAANITCLAIDGIEFLKESKLQFDTIYLDPARRSSSTKVFKLKDCTPDVTAHLDLFLSKARRIIVKTAPLLDITAGLSELKKVSEIHIVSVKNECKELLWVIDRDFTGETQIICTTLNQTTKTFAFPVNELKVNTVIESTLPTGYLYEPDVALLKSGAFNLIAEKFGLKKLHTQSHLYYSEEIKPQFLGRIFEIEALLNPNELKKEKNLKGNVIVRNFPEKAENLSKKYKISSSHDHFILFTQTQLGYLVIKAKIIQHY